MKQDRLRYKNWSIFNDMRIELKSMISKECWNDMRKYVYGEELYSAIRPITVAIKTIKSYGI